VAADQIFFQRYFAQKHEKEQARAAKVDKRKVKYHGSDTESDQGSSSDVGSDPEEAVIWKAMKASMPRAEGHDDEDEDDDDEDDGSIEHSIRSSEPDEPAFSDTEGDQEGLSDSEYDGNVDGEFNDNWFSFSEASETVDSVHIDTEVPVDLTKRRQADSAVEESLVSGGGKKRRRNGSGKEDVLIRKKLRALPTFASYEDFAQMIEDEPEEYL